MIRVRISLCVALLFGACTSEPETIASTPLATASADGVCKEHGVLEAVCTKCNPALAAVFRAKGDFCEEHGFPGSFCPICHPEKGGRPTTDVTAADGAPADGMTVRFKSPDVTKRAGIEVAPVTTRASAAALEVTAKLVYDATKVAVVNARSVGVVRTVSADIGSRVRRGSPLATIESADVGANQARVEAARARVQLAEATHVRLSGLQAEGITAQKDVLAAAGEVQAARAELSAMQAALAMVGGVGSASSYVLTSPIAGVVTQRNATAGHLVSTDDALFEVVDTSVMWAELDIPESAAGRTALDQVVTLQFDGAVSGAHTGSLSYVAPQIDVHTRMALGRVQLDNPAGQLRANMFAHAQIQVGSGADTLAVPREALQRAKDIHMVFVQVAPDAFEVRRVQVGESDAARIEVRGRLQVGDKVATVGSFLLKTETLKGSIGAGCCDVEAP